MNLEKLKDTARKHEQKEDWRRAIEVYLKAIQQIESNIIMPIVERRTVTIPPALLLFAVPAEAALGPEHEPLALPQDAEPGEALAAKAFARTAAYDSAVSGWLLSVTSVIALAGVYLLARTSPIFAHAVRAWSVMPPFTTMRFAAGSNSDENRSSMIRLT